MSIMTAQVLRGAPASRPLEFAPRPFMLQGRTGMFAMIRYSLKCAQDHRFESWFASSAAYDALRASGHVTCPDCGTPQVDKALMAPRVAADRDAQPAAKNQSSAPDPRAEALARLRDEVEKNSEYVGLRFAAEARRMHAGDVPERAIFGEARIDEARALIADGVPIAPLPFVPRRKAN